MNSLKTLFSGGAALFILMGSARFAFTPHLPLMQKDFMFSDTFSGFLASSNYLGYLIGSVASLKISGSKNIRGIFLLSIWTSLLLICGMYFNNPFLWVTLRFFSGFTSAIGFVLCLIMVLNNLAKTSASHYSGTIYIGLGLSMSVSGFALPLLYRYFNSSDLWIYIAGISVIPAMLTHMIPAAELHRHEHEKAPYHCKKGINLLYFSYFLEGLGYIVTGTFISVIVLRNTGSVFLSGNVWVIAGLAAMAATPLWPLVAKKFGTGKTLIFIYIIQAVSISMPVLSGNATVSIAGAAGYGGTFLGIVILTLMFGREIDPAGRTTAFLTTFFSLGQIIGPVTAGYLSDLSGSFQVPVISASVIVLTSAVFVFMTMRSVNINR